MTMNTRYERHIGAGEFKAKCLALLDEVATTHQAIVVTKRGKPIARLLPMGEETHVDLAGSIVREDDVLSPINVDWNVNG